MTVLATARRETARLIARLAARLRAGSRHQRRRRRLRLAHEVLHGDGLEIGALHQPLPPSPSMRVTYVDHLDDQALRHHYPELAAEALVPVDLVAAADRLDGIADASQDFVIASHLLEHCENPLGALAAWLRVLRPGGVIFLAVPEKTLTFDHRRPVTSFDHLLRDAHEGPEGSRTGHYLEWARLVEGLDGVSARTRAAELEATGYSIHFHVWTAKAFADFLDRAARPLDSAFALEHFVPNGDETLAVLRRRPLPHPSSQSPSIPRSQASNRRSASLTSSGPTMKIAPIWSSFTASSLNDHTTMSRRAPCAFTLVCVLVASLLGAAGHRHWCEHDERMFDRVADRSAAWASDIALDIARSDHGCLACQLTSQRAALSPPEIERHLQLFDRAAQSPCVTFLPRLLLASLSSRGPPVR
ncbi:MAG: methyltransferase domain-containing protein [Acidobacteriota bacterium]